jgi:hypothetical protein
MAITSRMLGERGKRQARELGIDQNRVPPVWRGVPVSGPSS